MRRFWTVAEIVLLRKLYPTHAVEDIAKTLGRTTDAVWMKAKELGVCKQVKHTDATPVPPAYREEHERRIRWHTERVEREEALES